MGFPVIAKQKTNYGIPVMAGATRTPLLGEIEKNQYWAALKRCREFCVGDITRLYNAHYTAPRQIPMNRSMIPIPKPIPGRAAPRAKLASTIVLLRQRGGEPEILMGKRSARHDFMPSVYVFPGGRVDPCDSTAPALDRPNSRTREILEAAMTPTRARACVLAAVRETYEETSLVLGEKFESQPNAINDPSWKAFHTEGYLPSLANIELFGRAITPPHRDKRFDTWFFLARLNAEAAARPFKNSAELVDTGWFTFAQMKQLKMHRATEMMIEQLETYLEYDNPPPDIFFSRAIRGKFCFTRFPEHIKSS